MSESSKEPENPAEERKKKVKEILVKYMIEEDNKKDFRSSLNGSLQKQFDLKEQDFGNF